MSGPRRGLGNLYRRGTIWWFHFSISGRVIRRSTGTAEYGEALKVYMRARLDHGLTTGQPATFSDLKHLVLTYYATRRLRSARRVRSAFAKLAEEFDGGPAASITMLRLTGYVKTRQDAGAADATVQYELAMLRRAMKLAHRAGMLDSVPVFPTIQVHNARTGFMEGDGWERLLEHLPEEQAMFIEWLYWTGWRQDHARNLLWRQVDMEHGSIILERGIGKNRSGLVLPFRAHHRLRAILDHQLARRGDGDHVFGLPGQTERAVRGAWEKARKAAGLPTAYLHDFRRTAARRFVRTGTSERVAMQLLGMKTRSIFDRYNVTNEADMVAALERTAPPLAQKRHRKNVPEPGIEPGRPKGKGF